MAKELTQVGQICTALDQMEGSLNESLQGTGVSVKRFLATAKTAVQTHTDQKGLEEADRQSLYLAIKKAASDGLMPDNREAALVIYNTKQGDGTWVKQVQYQPMTQGLVKLARNSGEIDKISSNIVYENDHFKFNPAQMDFPEFNPDWFRPENRGAPIGVWTMIKLNNGEYINEMLTKERVDRIATRSKIAKNYDPKQGKDWEEWWKKTGIRNALKYAPKSTALDQAIKESDQEFEFDDNVIDYTQPVNPVSDKPKTETAAAKAVKSKAKAKEKEPEPKEVIDGETGEIIDVEPEKSETEEEELPV